MTPSSSNPHPPAGFFKSGGTLEPNAPSYVVRQADAELYTHLQQGEFCYVLTSRQMGKSSLMVQVTARLRKEGVGVVVIDLTLIGQNLTAEQWYASLLERIGQHLGLEDELEEYWLEREQRSPLQRWLGALKQVVLARRTGQVVIFVDEIDIVRSLPFSTDEFFAAIRACYNRRTEEPEFARLTFCLLGVATPSDLIQDTRMTPFNIGRRIELTDFTEAEVRPLGQGLGRSERLALALLRRVLYWTGGQPCLTQRLCRAVAEDATVTGPGGVDRLSDELFLSHGARERDDNLLFVRDHLLRTDTDVAALLDLYARVRGGQRIPDDTTDPRVSRLRLSGIVRAQRGRLQVRNRIYETVFDGEWVRDNMPGAELRRQRAAARIGSQSVVPIVTMLALMAVHLVLDRSPAQSNTGTTQTGDNRPRVTIQLNHLCCSGCYDDTVRAMESLKPTWLYNPTVLKPDLPTPEQVWQGVDGTGQRGNPTGYAGSLIAHLPDSDFSMVDFVALDQAVRKIGLVPARIELAGIPHFRLTAHLPRLCCPLCETALHDALAPSTSVTIAPSSQLIAHQVSAMVAAEKVDVELIQQLVTADFRDHVDVSQFIQVLDQTGFAPDSIHLERMGA